MSVTGTYTSEPIAIPPQAARGGFARADLVLEGLEQAGPSFVGYVFLNNPAADDRTARTSDTGYAGAVHVYGQGSTPEDAQRRGGELLAPITKRLIATDAVRAAIRDAGELTVTVVPVSRGGGDPAPLRLDRVSIAFS